jgi:hypothetical protein
MYKFQSKYFFAAAVLFVVEVLIAMYFHDRFIRPYFGDFLVVILLYCFVKSFLDLPVKETAIGVLLFSYLIEICQYFNIVAVIGLQDSKIASTVIGTSFEWIDLLAYTLGVLTIIWFENHNLAKSTQF